MIEIIHNHIERGHINLQAKFQNAKRADHSARFCIQL